MTLLIAYIWHEWSLSTYKWGYSLSLYLTGSGIILSLFTKHILVNGEVKWSTKSQFKESKVREVRSSTKC